jgi:hypothetical protein
LGGGFEKMTTINGVHGVLLSCIAPTVRLVAAKVCPVGLFAVVRLVYGLANRT